MKLFGNVHLRRGADRRGTDHNTGLEASPSFGDSVQGRAEQALQPSTRDPAKELIPRKTKFSVGMVVVIATRTTNTIDD